MFAEILKQKRNELGITQSVMAEQLFVSRQNVSNWENGKNYPDIPTLIMISEKYELSIDFMLKGDQQFMKKVEDDYKLIKQNRTKRIASYLVTSSLLLVMIISIFGILFRKQINENVFAIIILLLCIPLLGASYFVYKSFYPDKNQPQELFIPKMYGIGLTINPNHPIGKIVWIMIGVGILGALLYSVVSFI